jgi:hypothetical protein
MQIDFLRINTKSEIILLGTQKGRNIRIKGNGGNGGNVLEG